MEEKLIGERKLIYDTGDVKSKNPFLDLPEIIVKSSARYSWTVEITDNYGEKCCAKDEARFETGLLYQSDWKAGWVEPNSSQSIKMTIHLSQMNLSRAKFWKKKNCFYVRCFEKNLQ